MENYLNVFMDESGKEKNKISLMGGISIPKECYRKKSIQNLNRKLRNNDFKLHFTHYNNKDFGLYMNVLDTFLEVEDLIDVNIMAYKRSDFRIHPLLSSRINDMIYEKVPQRVVYGLLRKQSDLKSVIANVYVENSTEYRDRNLDKQIKKQVNTHALYRFNNFKIQNSKLVPKNTEIGVEFTDLIIGIVRFIILNSSVLQDNNRLSKTALHKYELIYKLLPKLKQFLLKINLYELRQQDYLDKIPFENYLKFFEAHLNSLYEEGYLDIE